MLDFFMHKGLKLVTRFSNLCINRDRILMFKLETSVVWFALDAHFVLRTPTEATIWAETSFPSWRLKVRFWYQKEQFSLLPTLNNLAFVLKIGQIFSEILLEHGAYGEARFYPPLMHKDCIDFSEGRFDKSENNLYSLVYQNMII